MERERPLPPELLDGEGEPLVGADDGDVVVELTLDAGPTQSIHLPAQELDAELARHPARGLPSGRLALRMALLRRARAS